MTNLESGIVALFQQEVAFRLDLPSYDDIDFRKLHEVQADRIRVASSALVSMELLSIEQLKEDYLRIDEDLYQCGSYWYAVRDVIDVVWEYLTEDLQFRALLVGIAPAYARAS